MRLVIVVVVGVPLCLQAQWDELDGGLSFGGPRTLSYDSASAVLYAFGQFDFANDTIDVGATAMWASNGWMPMASGQDGPGGINNPIASCLYQNSVCIGGFFASISGVEGTRGLAQWQGGAWYHLGRVDPIGVPIGLTVLDDELHALGRFDSIDGVWCNNWGIYDGLSWRRADTTVLIDNRPVTVLRYQGDLYLAGNYSMPGGLHDIARKTLGSWESLGPGLGCDPWVNDMVEFEGLLYVAGEFCPIGPGASYLMVWDGSQWYDPFPHVEFTAQVRDLHIMNGRLVMAGRFVINGQPQEYGLAYYDGDQFCIIGGEDLALLCLGGAGDSLFVSTITPTLTGLPGADTVNFIAKWDMNNAPDTCFTVVQGMAHLDADAITVHAVPNPATGETYLVISGSEHEGPIRVDLFDALGRIAYQKILAPGTVGVQLPLGGLSSGLYQMRVSATRSSRFALGNLVIQR